MSVPASVCVYLMIYLDDVCVLSFIFSIDVSVRISFCYILLWVFVLSFYSFISGFGLRCVLIYNKLLERYAATHDTRTISRGLSRNSLSRGRELYIFKKREEDKPPLFFSETTETEN